MRENRRTDITVYKEEFSAWLPDHIIDCHVHVSLKDHCGQISPDRYKSVWAMEVGIHQSWDELRLHYERLFPDRRVSALVFGGVYHEIDNEADNRYVLTGCADEANSAKALYVSRPECSATQVANALAAGFIGLKPYPDLAPRGMNDSSVFDFVPLEHLRVLNDFGGLLMLHLPRPGRLADPDNIKEVLRITDEFPNIFTILPHVGRAYGLPAAREGLKHFRGCERVYFDLSANVNAEVFMHALETIGVGQILYGSDLPITMMRGVREHNGDSYTNFTDEPYSWNTSRKSPEEEARYTYFVYQEIRALISALRSCGLGTDAMQRIMNSNAGRLISLASGTATQGAAAVHSLR